MAGLGAKLFASFTKLTAADVNGYLADQAIMRFATSTARDAAFGGAGEPTLAEGMTCYLDDTNQVQSYNGTAWVSIASSTTPTGLQLIKTQALTAQTQNVAGVFSSEFDNYRIIITTTASSATGGNIVFLRPNNISTTVYGGTFIRSYGATVNALANDNNRFVIGYMSSTSHQYSFSGDMMMPNQPVPTLLNFQAFGYNGLDNVNYAGGMNLYTTAQYTDLTVGVDAGTMTGTIRVYGYRNS